jgi:hypothetical protein
MALAKLSCVFVLARVSSRNPAGVARLRDLLSFSACKKQIPRCARDDIAPVVAHPRLKGKSAAPRDSPRFPIDLSLFRAVILNGAPQARSEGSMHFARACSIANAGKMHGSFAALRMTSRRSSRLYIDSTAPSVAVLNKEAREQIVQHGVDFGGCRGGFGGVLRDDGFS